MVQRIKEEDRIVLTLGGDHSIALGTVHGILKHYETVGGPTPCVLWIDAHADINTTVGVKIQRFKIEGAAFLLQCVFIALYYRSCPRQATCMECH